MTENVAVNPISRPSLGIVLVGVGAILIGLALLVIASQWQTYPRIALESPPTPKVGFAWISETEKSSNQYIDDKHFYYLLDKDTGRVWRRTGSIREVWEELYVEGITPSDSPAAQRK
ncbi:DUF2157 domain-containing protein [Stenotrophomonas acidaminiphila]|uniref:DUF2157 domain-containing protein n=1 Tax=Stenotrophomonas acidaminiphila TaxID=128780 RepID=UPI0020C6BC7C|nr:DUF2157 domain-containing protein [Stenotrophomonas acidaminiphila]